MPAAKTPSIPLPRSWTDPRPAAILQVIALAQYATVTTWMKWIDHAGPNALVQLPVPVNRFPNFVR